MRSNQPRERYDHMILNEDTAAKSAAPWWRGVRAIGDKAKAESEKAQGWESRAQNIQMTGLSETVLVLVAVARAGNGKYKGVIASNRDHCCVRSLLSAGHAHGRGYARVKG